MLRLTPALFAGVSLVMPAAAQTARTKLKPSCNPTASMVVQQGDRGGARKLGEMPPATQIYTVYNAVDGCPVPVVVRDGIGADPARKQSPVRTPPRKSSAR